ncbi:MAG: ssl1498 family light-harvesting-like protein [Sodalinema sp.]|uniref:photosystem II assembly protein Psb34 n=1 Tax=Sodalinema sp. TaxID=3080550 RepID=UPI0012243835|nr:MAG: ssl1498 family light-harvesting-like protein [Phormidium sp. SL48-SHIP]
MPYVDEEGGRLNNYAIEPKMYEAEPPTREEKRNYAVLGTLAALFVVGIIAVAYAVSTVS